VLGFHSVFGLVAFFLGIPRGFSLYFTIMGDGSPGTPLDIMIFGPSTWPNNAQVAFFTVLGMWLCILSFVVIMFPLMALWILALALPLNGSWYLFHKGAYVVFRFVQSLYRATPTNETFEMEPLDVGSSSVETPGTISSRSPSN